MRRGGYDGFRCVFNWFIFKPYLKESEELKKEYQELLRDYSASKGEDAGIL